MAINEYEIKKMMCDIGKRIYDRNMVAANDGNFSVKISDNEILCTPTGVSKGFMTPEFICKIDMQGNVLQANGNFRPSSEIKMHLRVYEKRPDVGAVVHAHPNFATAFAIAGIPLTQPIMPKLLSLWAAFPSLSTAHRPPLRFRTTSKNTFRTTTLSFWRATAH